MAITTSDRDPRPNPSEQAAPPPVPESGQCPKIGEQQVYNNPIPDMRMRFVNDVGEGFALGLLGSSAFSLLRGLCSGGLAGAARAVGASAPRGACALAAYFGVYSAVDSAMSVARRKEDLWNGLAAGATSWAALGMRRGAAGAGVLAVCWGLNFLADLEEPEETPRHQPTRSLPAAAAADGFWGIPHGPPVQVQEVPAAELGF